MDRAALRELIAKKDRLEAEAEAITEQLSASNMGGVSGPLIDAEGFPRADVDVHATRTLRHRLACLNTDHRSLMGQIERGMHELHAAAAPPPAAAAPAARPPQPAAAAAPAASSAPPSGSGSAPTAVLNGDAAQLKPFALIDTIDPAGPAASAGLRLGDRLLRFGNVHADNHDGLRALARLTQRSEGGEVPVIVQRDTEQVELRLRPRTWSGPGLLGCHLTPEASS